ncbi:MAG: hypothetical protein ACRC78_12660 [Planktothrix sp.]
MNGSLINDQVVFCGNGTLDYFLFSEKFEASLEEMVNGEIRADWEDEDDDEEKEEIMGFTPYPENSFSPPNSPIKIELTIKINLSINGQTVDLQIGSLGDDTNASFNEGQETRSPLYGEDEFGGGVLRI